MLTIFTLKNPIHEETLKLWMEGNFLNLIKFIYKKYTENFIIWETEVFKNQEQDMSTYVISSL